MEGSFNYFGNAKHDFDLTYDEPSISLRGSGASEFEARAFSAAALLTVPLGRSFSLGLRAGMSYSTLERDLDQEFRFNGIPNQLQIDDSKSSFEPVYGANLEYAATNIVSVRLDWQTFRDAGKDSGFDGFDLDLLTLSIIGRF